MSRRRKRISSQKEKQEEVDEIEESSSSFSSLEQEEYYSSSSFSSGYNNRDYETLEYSWQERNEYVQMQLKIMHDLSVIARNSAYDDEYFSFKLQAKIENMYHQIEPLLEAESATAMIKAYVPFDDGKKTSITKEIKRLGLNLEDQNLKNIGIKSARKFRKVYGRPPRKIARYIKGKPMLVNEYTEEQAEHTILNILEK